MPLRVLVVLLAAIVLRAGAQSGLPSDWRQGIATNYGQGVSLLPHNASGR
jgi:hypothetical protein